MRAVMAPAERDALGRATARAAVWAFMALTSGRIVSLAALACLARLLAPEDFGLLAFALVFITYAETITDLGTSAALIYWPNRDAARDDVARITFVISLGAGFVWLALAWLAAPWVGGFFRSPETTPILRALAFTFPLKAFGTTHDALAQKDLDFRARFVPEVGLAALKAAVSIALAIAGFGVWSLVWGQLAGVLAWTVLLWIVVPWRPGARLRREMVRPVLAYGRGIVAVNLLAAVVHHADLIVVGRMLGAAALGFYQVAGRVPDVTLMMVLRVAGRILFPAFARVSSDRASLRAAYLAALRYVAVFVLPAATALFVLADPLVRVAFGAAWVPSVPILRALAVYVGLRAVGTHAGDVLKAVGRPGLLAWLGTFKAAALVPALIVAARMGAPAVAAALASVTLLSVFIDLAIVSRLLTAPARDLAAALRPAVACAAAMAVVLALWMAGAALLPASLTLAGGAALAVATYAVVVARLAPDIRSALVTGFGRRTSRAVAEVAPALAGGRQ